MQREPHAPRYVKGECYAEPHAADIEQLHAVPPMQPCGFDACVGGEMQSYLKKKDNSLKKGVNWIRSQCLPFPIKIILICTCLHVTVRGAPVPRVLPSLAFTRVPGTHRAWSCRVSAVSQHLFGPAVGSACSVTVAVIQQWYGNSWWMDCVK